MVPVPQEQQISQGSGIRFRAGMASLVCGVVASGLGRSEGSLRAIDWCKIWDAGTPGCRLRPGVANPCSHRLDSFDRIGLDVQGVVR